MRRLPKSEVLSLVLIACMFALGIGTWSIAPDRIPMHWDVSGRPDRYGGKVEGLFLLPALAAAVHFFFSSGRPREDAAIPPEAARTGTVAVLFLVYLAVILSIRGFGVEMEKVGVVVLSVALLAVAYKVFRSRRT